MTASVRLPSPLSPRESPALGFLPSPRKAFEFFDPGIVWSGLVELLFSHMEER